MTIREQLDQLYQLAQIDQQIREFKEKERSLPLKANEAKTKALDASVRESSLSEQLKVLELKRNQQDLEMQTEKGNLRKWESRADKIKGEREYTTLMSEIGSQKKTISNLETKMLELMAEQDKLRKDLDVFKKAHAVAEALYEEEWSKVESEIKQLSSELSVSQDGRVSLIAGLPATLGKRYEQIASKRAGIGISVVSKGVCLACKRAVPHELFNRVSKAEILESCPFCNRLLVAEKLS